MKTMTKFTRSDYMANRCSHREYYGQFVTDSIKDSVTRWIGLKALMASTDSSLNDIRLSKWDNTPGIRTENTINQVKEAGDFLTLSGVVCIAKEAARQVIEDNK